MQRRRFLHSGGWVCGAAASGFASGVLSAKTVAASSFDPARERLVFSASDAVSTKRISRIAFGSCANQDRDQPILDAIAAARPDLFMFLGDAIYGDTRDITHLRAQYAKLAAKPEFRRLRATTPLLAVWDDHDFGENDAGASYPLKEQSRQTFLEFWQEPANSMRRSRNGIYTSRVFGPQGSRVQIIAPDLRYNRTPLTLHDLGVRYEEWEAAKRAAGVAIHGPYARCADRAASMLGERQWQWLQQQFDVPADIRIIASSLQVLADFPGWEAWINYACDHQRLIELIRRKQAAGVLFVSGDTHYAELSKLDLNVPYPLWDLTCSGLTEVWDVDVPNANRVGGMVREQNFGLIDIEWSLDPTITLKACDRYGVPKIAHTLQLSALRAS